MTEPALDARNVNTLTTAALRFDNHLDWCNHPHPQERIGSDDDRLDVFHAVQRSSFNGGGSSRFDLSERFLVREDTRRPSPTILQL
jgi:hypothetical protein